MRDNHNRKRDSSSFTPSLSANNRTFPRRDFTPRGGARGSLRGTSSSAPRGNFRGSFRGGQTTNGRGGFQRTQPQAPVHIQSIDTSNLHPSWQAKKQLEERAKMKFQGKKVKFDD